MGERSDSRPIKDDERARLNLARDWLIAHADTHPDLKRAAKVARLSPFHFLRRFKLCFDTTPKRIVFEQQIEKAKRLMLSGEKLKQVVKLSGFCHQPHFTKRFRHATGQTPARWLIAQRSAATT